MNHTTIRDAIKLALRTALGWTASSYDGRIEWGDEGAACYDRQFPKIDLLLINWIGIGIDETRHNDPEDLDPEVDGEFGSQQTGNRSVVLQIKVLSDSACGNSSAGAVSVALRLRIKRASVLEVLYAAGVSIQRIAVTQDIPYADLNVMFTASITDVTLGLVDVDDFDTEAPGTDYFTDVDFQKED